MVPSIVSPPRRQDFETAMVRLCGFAQRHPDLALGREPGVVASGHGMEGRWKMGLLEVKILEIYGKVWKMM